MKNLLLASTSALVVAIASPAFAGSSATYLLQTGNGQQATIDQSGGNNNRVGTEARPFLQQNGTGNPLFDGTGGNVISITQNGSGNVVAGYGPYDNGGVHPAPAAGKPGQSGTNNHATVLQNGLNGDVQLTQTGHNNGTTAGYGGSITQEATTNGNHAWVIDYGDNNDFTITQRGSSGTQNHNYAILQQGYGDLSGLAGMGFYNLASITQEGGPNTGHSLNSSQFGSYNTLSSVQSGTALGNTLNSYQNGTGLNAGQQNSIQNSQTGSNELAQIGTSNYPGNTNGQNGFSLTIVNNQSGVGDKLYVGQGSFAGVSFAAGQLGHNNTINNTQSGSSNTATAAQEAGSSNNTVTMTQNGGSASNYIYSDQKGTQNDANLTQNGSSSSYIVSLQNGSVGPTVLTKNTVNMTQTGATNSYAYLGQGADFTNLSIGGTTMTVGSPVYGNTINGNQAGSFQLAGVSQQSNSNTASFNQSGSNNVANIKQ